MKKTILYTLGAICLLSSCKKEGALVTTADTNQAYVSFINVNSSSKTINVFIDQKQVNATGIAVNGTITGVYAGVASGSRALLTRDVSTALPPVDYYAANINVAAGRSYSFFQYGVLTAGVFKGLLLFNERAADANADNARIRFLNISNGAPALDLVFVRSEGTTVRDSVVLFTGAQSLASIATPDVNALSSYKSLAGNKAANAVPGVAVSSYILRVKLAGTNTVISSTAATTIVPGRNYTFYARGTYPSAILSTVLDN